MERPQEIYLKGDHFKAVVQFRDEKLINGKLVDINIAPTLFHLQEEQGKKPVLPIEYAKRSEIYEKFNDLTYSIGKIIRLSEMVHQSLKSLVESYLFKNNLEEVFERNSKCKNLKKYDFTKDLTFMQLKQTFSCILKTDKNFHQFEDLNDAKKREEFTQMLTNYIIDRDCYVHGTLYFFYPDYIPILKVKPPGKIEHYVSINENVLRDNLAAFLMIDKIFDSFLKYRNGMSS